MSNFQIVLLDTDQLHKKKLKTSGSSFQDKNNCAELIRLFENSGHSVMYHSIGNSSQQSDIHDVIMPLVQNTAVVLIPFFDDALFHHPVLCDCLRQIAENYLLISFVACHLPAKMPKILQHFDDVVISEKNVDQDADRLCHCFNHQLKNRNRQLPSRAQVEAFFELNFVGETEAYLQLLNRILKVSQCDAPLHIQGETGTGKEMAARSVHYFGSRKDHGFLPLNCAAVPDSLFESELFGHEKGAFTNAQQRHSGLVELANNGTLFLDEVDSLSEKAQSALLRFLQTGEYRAVGSTTLKYANTRIISATNADLNEQVRAGKFRQDLMFRLNVLNITIPPLRERQADINVIAAHLLQNFARTYGKGRKLLHPSYLNWLKRQSWPGNVRELENSLLREYFMQEDTLLKAPDDPLPASVKPATSNVQSPMQEEVLLTMSYQDAKETVLANFNSHYIRCILSKAGGNVTQAALLAGKERRAFGKLAKRYGVV